VIVLDTTVLVYAVGDAHDFREPCRQLVEAVRSHDIQATTTVEVIQEFAHVRARRRSRADAAELARAYADLLAPLMVVEEKDLIEGLRLFESLPSLGAFDAVLAAAANRAGAAALVSADIAYATAPRVHHVVPDAAGVNRLLS
jgi:uncharacterized protein